MGIFANEALLTQLGYNTNGGTREKIKKIIKNTRGFENIQRRILNLSNMLKPYKSYITLSNSEDFLKIKFDSLSSAMHIDEAKNIIHKWADKYNIELKKAEAKEIYYIVGVRN